MSLTIRLTLTYLLVTLGGLLLLGAGAVALAGTYTAQQRMRALNSQADLYATYLSEVVTSADALPSLAPDLATRATLAPGTHVRIFARNGERLAGESTLGPFPSRAALALVSSGLPLPVSQVSGWRYVARSITGSAGAVGIVELSQPTDDEQALQRTLLQTVAQAALGAALVMALVSLLVARSIAQPIGRLQALAESLAAGSLDLRAVPLISQRRPRRDEIGRLAASLDYMADQLQRRIAEAECERTRLSAVLTSISEGVIALDAEGTLLFANPAAERLLNAEPTIDHQLPISEQIKALELHMVPGKLTEREATVGSRQLVLVGRPLASAAQSTTSHPIASVWIIRDVTRLNALEQARTRFIRSISHELRTPLTAMRGTLENLRDDARNDQQDALTSLEDETLRLARLVDELLRPRADGTLLPTERRPVQIGTLARELCALQAGRARRAGINLMCDAKADLPSVAGDRDRLKQVLLNLLDNALRATPPGGGVQVSVKAGNQSAVGNQQSAGDENRPPTTDHRPPITDHRSPTTVRITVEDTGPGVPPELRERIWERGVSGSDLGLEDTGGAGLGLALVREIVEAYGGRAWVEPHEAAGARFVIELPGMTLASL